MLGHELVHVFQYDIAENGDVNGLARMGTLPGWLIEGMAEYFSLGRNSELTAMWMRDAVERDSFPTIKQLNTDPRYFPYRYGQALWAYVAGRWGERAVVDVYRSSLRMGLDNAITRVLGEVPDSLSADWSAANKALYTSQLVGRTKPKDAGQPVVHHRQQGGRRERVAGDQPRRQVRGVLLVARRCSATTCTWPTPVPDGIIRSSASPSSDPHFDALNFVSSSGAWSPDGKQFAFIVDENGKNDVAILDVTTARSAEDRSCPAWTR